MVPQEPRNLRVFRTGIAHSIQDSCSTRHPAEKASDTGVGRDPKVRYVDYEAIEQAFARIAKVAREHQLEVHYPLIGAGLANGDWGVISKIINQQLEGVSHTLWTLPGAEPTKPNSPRP